MAKYCGSCGSPQNDSATFCGACGGAMRSPAYTPVAGSPVASSAPAAQKQSNTLLKVVLIVVVLLFVGGVVAVAGAIYAAHKVSQKVHSVTQQLTQEAGLTTSTDNSPATSSSSDTGISGDPCRFLSASDVGHAIGVEIIKTASEGDACAYIAKGDPADMTSKHMAAMLGTRGADAQSQQIIQKVAGGFFQQQEAGDKDLSAQAAKGEVTVLSVSFQSSGNAALEMGMNRKVFQNLPDGTDPSTNPNNGTHSGLGDESVESSGTMLMVRKGKVLARFLYPDCPCSTPEIRPLAQKLVAQL